MKKFDYFEPAYIVKSFVKQLSCPYLFFLIPLSLAYTIVLLVLTFARKLVEVLFRHVELPANDSAAVKAATVVAFAPLLYGRNMALGGLDVFIFLFGLFFDINNALVTLGKGQNSYINFK